MAIAPGTGHQSGRILKDRHACGCAGGGGNWVHFTVMVQGPMAWTSKNCGPPLIWQEPEYFWAVLTRRSVPSGPSEHMKVSARIVADDLGERAVASKVHDHIPVAVE